MKKHLLFILFLFLSNILLAQNTKIEREDSLRIANNINRIKDKHGINRYIYNILFKPTKAQINFFAHKRKKPKYHDNSYALFESRVIRNIVINVFDPFGNTVEDSSMHKSKIKKLGNALHKKTINNAIQHLILINKFDIFDSLLVKESERLLRVQNFIYDLSFTSFVVGNDSVDIYIRVLDVWTILPKGSFSKNSTFFNINDRNLFGLTHQIDNTTKWVQTTGNRFNETNYYISTIGNTYINSNINYKFDANKNVNRSIAFNLPFFSAYSHWAGGIKLSQALHVDSFYFDSTTVLPKFNAIAQDYWLGKAFKILKGNSYIARSTKLIVSARFANVSYIDKQSMPVNTLDYFANIKTFLLGIAISERKYVDDKYIFRFGIKENVPVGKIFALTGAYQISNQVKRFYAGVKIGFGTYTSFGYLSPTVEYGNFFSRYKLNEGIARLSVSYFTNRLSIGKWKLRQFVKPQFTLGINRADNNSLNLNNDLGIKQFSGYGLQGTNKLVVTIQTQLYAPWNVIGFKFGPYISYSFGMLGNATNGFRNSRAYSQFGVGLLLTNAYLVLNSFEISLAFYPYIRGIGNNIFKPNPYKNSNFGFKDFDVTAPSVVSYQ